MKLSWNFTVINSQWNSQIISTRQSNSIQKLFELNENPSRRTTRARIEIEWKWISHSSFPRLSFPVFLRLFFSFFTAILRGRWNLCQDNWRNGWVIRGEWHARPSSWMGFRDRLSKPNDRIALDNLNRENFCSFQKQCSADAGINTSVRGLASMLSACRGKEKHYEIHAAWCTVICNRGPSSNCPDSRSIVSRFLYRPGHYRYSTAMNKSPFTRICAAGENGRRLIAVRNLFGDVIQCEEHALGRSSIVLQYVSYLYETSIGEALSRSCCVWKSLKFLSICLQRKNIGSDASVLIQQLHRFVLVVYYLNVIVLRLFHFYFIFFLYFIFRFISFILYFLYFRFYFNTRFLKWKLARTGWFS